MSNLRATLDHLTSSFADDVIRALKGVPLSELMRLASRSTEHRAQPPPKSKRASAGARSPKPKGRPRRQATAARASVETTPDDSMLEAVEALFKERGTRGATAMQVQAHMDERGVTTSADAAITVLVQRGIIRDAGFRRTTGKGTAAVYVADTPPAG